MPDCPSDADLTGFLDDSLPPERVTGVSAHVDGCLDCQDRLDKLTHDKEGAVARYKELSSIRSGPATPVSSPEAGTLIIGVNSLPRPAGPVVPGLPAVPGFDVAEEIGRGGMGVVYKARHRRLNRLCALKMILAGGAADTRTVQRFLYEAEILARVQHPQVVQVFEVDTYQGPAGVPIPYLAMELLEGGSLSRRLREGPLPPRDAAGLIEGLAHAVHVAHLQGIVHRDLKPGNVLFPVGGRWPAGEKDTPPPSSQASAPKVTDFGLAKFTEAGVDLTGSGQVVGTPHYMAPEQAAGGKQVGPPADVYALGAILFECLAGRPPFQGHEPMSVLLKVVGETAPDVRTLRPDVPRDLAAVVSKCLEKDPRRRYASSEELADDLRRFLENRPTVARPLRRRERVWLWARRNPAVATLAVVLALVLVVGFALVTWLWVHAEQNAKDERLAKELAKLSEARAQAEGKKAADSLADAKEQKKVADRHRAELEFGRAMNACEEGRLAEGLPRFVRAVELAEATGAADLARAARVNLAFWSRELPPPRRAFAHKEQPRVAAFTPDGRYMATAGRGRELYLWDLATGEKVRAYASAGGILGTVRDDTLWSVAFSPDGKSLAAGGALGDITVWATDSPQPRASFAAVGRGDSVWWVAFAPDGTLWAADGRTGVKRWDLAAKPAPRLLAHMVPEKPGAGVVNVVAVSADGSRVYTGDRMAIVREWDVAGKAELRTFTTRSWVQDIALSADGTRLAATGPGGEARVYDLATGNPTLEVSLAGSYGNGVAFAPKRPFLVTTDGDGNVRFWHRETGQPVGIPLRCSGEVLRPRFRPDSDQFVVAAGDSVYLCGLPDPPGDLVSAGHGHRVRGLAVAPDGRIAVTDDHTLDLFDPAGKRLLHSAEHVGPDPLTLAFDPARGTLYRGHRDGLDRLTPPRDTRAETLPSYGRVGRIEFARDGSAVFALGLSIVARYDPAKPSDVAAEKPVPDKPAGSELQAMSLRPDGGELLVTVGRRVVFLNPATLKPSRPGWAAADEILDAEYTADGKHVLVGRRDNVAEVLDAATGGPAPGVRPMPHPRAVAAVAVAPDGKTLLTACRDGSARFWDAASGLPLGGPLRHPGPVSHAVFAPTGDHVFTGTHTGHMMLWDIPPVPLAGKLGELEKRFGK